MRHPRYHILPDEIVQADADRQTAALGSLALVLALVIVSLILVRTLRRQSVMEDCMLQGLSNCDSLVVGQ